MSVKTFRSEFSKAWRVAVVVLALGQWLDRLGSPATGHWICGQPNFRLGGHPVYQSALPEISRL